jgi:hypothetical protein
VCATGRLSQRGRRLLGSLSKLLQVGVERDINTGTRILHLRATDARWNRFLDGADAMVVLVIRRIGRVVAKDPLQTPGGGGSAESFIFERTGGASVGQRIDQNMRPRPRCRSHIPNLLVVLLRVDALDMPFVQFSCDFFRIPCYISFDYIRTKLTASSYPTGRGGYSLSQRSSNTFHYCRGASSNLFGSSDSSRGWSRDDLLPVADGRVSLWDSETSGAATT